MIYSLKCQKKEKRNPQELFHNTNKMSWQRSQTPELFALCLSAWTREMERKRANLVFIFWGMSSKLREGLMPLKKKGIGSVSDPASVNVLWGNVSGKCHICMEKTARGRRGGSESEKMCNLMWSSGEKRWGWLGGTSWGWLLIPIYS